MSSIEDRFINRFKKGIAVEVDLVSHGEGVVFMAHGLCSSMQRPLFTETRTTFLKHGISVVRFDATNGGGDSDGSPEYATTTGYYLDLVDVIDWARSQEWWNPSWKTFLMGHSIGVMSCGLYIAKHGDEHPISGFISVAGVTDGPMSFEWGYSDEHMQEWERLGYDERKSGGRKYRLPWSHVIDRRAYTLFDHLSAFSMPISFIVGEADTDKPGTYEFRSALQDSESIMLLPLEDVGHSIKDPGALKMVNEEINTFLCMCSWD